MAAADRFSDVDPGSTHEAGIAWLVDQEVTAGCGDGSAYCPTDDVNRGRMATFLHRLSGHAPGIAPSVDAATVQGLDPADLQGATGPQGPPGAPGPRGPAGEDAASAWASISGVGNVLRGSGATSSDRRGTGQYTVAFDRIVTSCSFQATLSYDDGLVGPGVALTARGADNSVLVLVFDLDGDVMNRPFDLAVHC